VEVKNAKGKEIMSNYFAPLGGILFHITCSCARLAKIEIMIR